MRGRGGEDREGPGADRAWPCGPGEDLGFLPEKGGGPGRLRGAGPTRVLSGAPGGCSREKSLLLGISKLKGHQGGGW